MRSRMIKALVALAAVSALAVPAAAQALTGRVDIIPVLPLTQGEIDGVTETFVTRLLDGDGIEGLSPDAPAATRMQAPMLPRSRGSSSRIKGACCTQVSSAAASTAGRSAIAIAPVAGVIGAS